MMQELAIGWDKSVILLFVNATIDLLWGIALGIFALGVVPVTWAVSQWAKPHPGITSFVITVVATASTTHLKYGYQLYIDLYARAKLAEGFTRSDWEWMQGVKEWSLFAEFPVKLQVAWLLVYAAMALHSASITAILQPVDFVKNFPFNDAIPCAVQPTQLQFDGANISTTQQFGLDAGAIDIGQQWANYYAALLGNTTTAVMGRMYLKESVAYDSVGGLQDGLQDIPGVAFNASCGDGNSSLPAWAVSFPEQSSPTVSILNGAVSIVSDPQFNSSTIQSITNVANGNTTVFYGMVSTNGSGAFLVADALGNLTTCTWTTTPLTVEVRTLDFIASAANTTPSAQYPPYVGQGVLKTIQGIGNAIAMGRSLKYTDFDEVILFMPGGLNGNPPPPPPLTEVLQVVLADGTKAYLTGYVEASVSNNQGRDCNSKNRTISVHWRFGNQNGLGYIAIIFTALTGLFGMMAAIRLSKQRRLQAIEGPLDLGSVFNLGIYSGFDVRSEKVFDKKAYLRVYGGRVVPVPEDGRN
jgi:hypothetical protein